MNKKQLKDVIIDQHNKMLPINLVQRTAYNTVLKLKNTSHIIILTGLRRSGKSVLLQCIRHDSEERDYFVNFDDDRLVDFKLEDFQALYEILIELYGVQNTFYFDEIQNIPEWERFARRLHDQGCKIYITGSNATMLSKELGTRLTGRYIELNIYPYSFKEFLNYNQVTFPEKNLTTIQKGLIKSSFNDFLKRGGLPEYLSGNIEEYLHNLYESILYRDIIVRYNITHSLALKKLTHYLASNLGKEASFNSLKNIIGISSASTVSSYCDHIENSYLCFFVNRFDYSLKKQLNTPKKVYFIDQALGLNIGFRFSDDQGRLLENIVYIELKRRGFEIFYHKNKKECDFIIRKNGTIISAIQVCDHFSSETTLKREIEGLSEAMLCHSLSEGIILSYDTENEIIINLDNKECAISVIPIWRWLLS